MLTFTIDCDWDGAPWSSVIGYCRRTGVHEKIRTADAFPNTASSACSFDVVVEIIYNINIHIITMSITTYFLGCSHSQRNNNFEWCLYFSISFATCPVFPINIFSTFINWPRSERQAISGNRKILKIRANHSYYYVLTVHTQSRCNPPPNFLVLAYSLVWFNPLVVQDWIFLHKVNKLFDLAFVELMHFDLQVEGI